MSLILGLALALGLATITKAGPSMLVTPVCIPGGGNPDTAPVLRFKFTDTGPLSPLPSIPGSPTTLVKDPSYAAFNSQGELFVANRQGVYNGLGSIARFKFDAGLNYIPNGSITGNSLEAVCGLAFNTSGELFAANYLNGTISRFLFDTGGNPMPHDTIQTGVVNQGLAFASNGELFSTHSNDVVSRWVFDQDTGDAISNGSFHVAGATSLHGLTFAPDGELFLADPLTDQVLRLTFDNLGSPVANGSIPVAGRPVGLAFSEMGELFVTSHYSGGISRFLFDGSGNPIPNGFVQTDQLGGAAILPLDRLVVIPVPAAVTYDGDTLLSTGGNPTASASLVATLRNDAGNKVDIDGEEVTFTLTAEGVAGTIVVKATTEDGVATATQALEPAIYQVEVSLGSSDVTASAILVVYNPEGGFATGGGWILPKADGLNTHPNARANFGFNAKYKAGKPTGNIEFRYSDGYVDLKSSSIQQLVITGGKLAQFKGWASVNRQAGYWFFAKAIDNGEPGTNDTFEIKIWAPGANPEGDPSERAGGVLQGGNIVVHTK